MGSHSKTKEFAVIGILSVCICTFILWLVYFAPRVETNSSLADYLPGLFTLCNALCATFLIRGFSQIKNKKTDAHIKSMLTATGFSAGFLVLYILHYIFNGDAKFLGAGFIRPVYFTLLISHIVLSAVVVPFILTTLYNAFKKNYEFHKKVAKITFPLWLYVSVSGVLVYLIRTLYTL